MLTEMFSMLMTWRLFSFIATTFLFILWTASTEAHSVEAKAYVTEINQQSNVPDYISQAEVGVKKYYPEYEEYFKGIIKDIKWLWDYEQYLFNKETNRNLLNAWGLLKNEKEIITTVLISIEKVNWKEDFKKGIWISEDSNINDVSNDIIEWFFRKHERIINGLHKFEEEITNLTQKNNSQWMSSLWDEYITICEKYMWLLKDLYIVYGNIRKSKAAQEWVKQYIETLQETGRTPNQIGQKYIDEYNKINKK